MNSFKVIKKYEDKDIHIPKRATMYSAGYDIEAAEDVIVPSIFRAMKSFDKVCTIDEIKQIVKGMNLRTMVPTGLKVELDNDMYLELHVRSSIGCNCLLQLANQTGIIDADYYNNPDNEGHIFIALINLSPCDIQIKKGDRIAQGIFKKYNKTSTEMELEYQGIDIIYNSNEHTRKGGFGSTDKNK